MSPVEIFLSSLRILRVILKSIFQDIFHENYRFNKKFFMIEIYLVVLLTNYFYTVAFYERESNSFMLSFAFFCATIQVRFASGKFHTIFSSFLAVFLYS